MFYWTIFVIWVAALYHKCPRRVSGPSILIGALTAVLCCCVGWVYMAWLYFASDASIPEVLLRPEVTETDIVYADVGDDDGGPILDPDDDGDDGDDDD